MSASAAVTEAFLSLPVTAEGGSSAAILSFEIWMGWVTEVLE
jgi:hypothetical protein